MKDRVNYHILYSKEIDSESRQDWTDYLDVKRLEEAWKPPNESLYASFFKPRTIRAVESLKDSIEPRFSDIQETLVDIGMKNLIASGGITRNSLIVINQGGSQSVLTSVKFAELGFQPIIMFDGEPHPRGVVRSEQNLGAMLYFARKIDSLKKIGAITKDSPAALVMDSFRNVGHYFDTQVDNRYTLTNTLPSADFLQRQHITGIFYIDEADDKGNLQKQLQYSERFQADLRLAFQAWLDNGLEILQIGISCSGSHNSGLWSSPISFDFNIS